jgi:uncharacterized membrane protein
MAKQDTGMAAIAYLLLWLTGLIVFLIAKKEDKYTRFHALQSIFLGIFLMILGFLFSAIFSPLFFLRGGYFMWGWSNIVWVFTVIVVIVMAVNAYNGKKISLPFIGKLAEKYS